MHCLRGCLVLVFFLALLLPARFCPADEESKLPLLIAGLLLNRAQSTAPPFTAPPVTGKTYYLDPVHGSLDNDGSQGHPWPAFSAIVDRIGEDRTVHGGDALVLLSGYHGDVTVNGVNLDSYLTVKAGTGQTPYFSKLAFQGGSHWYLEGLTFRRDQPVEMAGGTLFSARDHGWHGPASHFILRNCTLFTREDTSAWSAADWSTRSASGISVGADHSQVLGNSLRNVAFGISIDGNEVTIAGNTIDGFCKDGMRGNGNDLLFAYNLVMNTYDVDENHDDGFQSFIVESSGTDAWERVTLRGNIFIGTTDPNRPFVGYLQGIGCFDGFYRDWIIENNIVIVDHWHGISLYGAENCRIVNNTVVANTLDPNVSGPPWIKIANHKDGRTGSGNIVANNIAHAYQMDAGVTMVSNYDIDAPAVTLPQLFADWPQQNVHLRDNPAVVDAGDPTLSPAIDQEGVTRPRGAGPDLGALERR